jgi:hypothetical protein
VGSREICRCYWRSDTITLAGIPPCRKKVASKCRPRATSTTVGLSLSCHGAHSRTQPTSKRRMGTSSLCRETPTLTFSHLPRNRLLTSGWWSFSRKPVRTVRPRIPRV